MKNNAPSVFLSHSHADKEFAHRLAEDLRSAGAEVWIDEAEIRLGDSLIQKISEAIDSVDYLAVVLSPTSVGSEWVRREVEIALNEEIAGQRVKVLPLLLATCEIPKFLIGRLYADFTGPDSYQNGVNMVLARLELYREAHPKRIASGKRSASESVDELLRRQAEKDQLVDDLAYAWHNLAPGFTVNKNGLKILRGHLGHFSMAEILHGMQLAAESYLVFDENDKVTQESWEKAFAKVGAICSVQQASQDNPELKDLYLIRGILKRRLKYVDDHVALRLLREAYAQGAQIDDLRTLALQASTWSSWQEDLADLLSDLQPP